MTNKLPLSFSKINPSVIYLWIAMLIGGYIRLSQVISSPFPLNDGGLFYQMTIDLMKNSFRLPEITTYNHLNISFSYPPLSFYLAGFLAELTGWNLIDIFRILPAIICILTIPAFYFLAKEFCRDEFQVILATFIFTLIPASYYWLIMGGGIPRALAFLLALLALCSIYRLYTRNQNRYIFLTATFSALTILTHPVTAFHTAVSALVFFLFFGRSKAGLIKSLAVAGLVILFSSPWWGTIIVRYGLGPLIAAGKTGMWGIVSAATLLLFNFTNEYGLQTIAALGLIGFFWHLAETRFFLPVWLVVVFLSSPRSAPVFLTTCIAILAGYSLEQILRIFNQGDKSSQNGQHPLKSLVSKATLAVLLVQWIYSALVTAILLAETMTLTKADKTAFDWIVTNTPAESRFLVLTGMSPLTDPVSEWFPALTGRVSIATIQGIEWDENNYFNDVLEKSNDLQNCNDKIPECLDNWLISNNVDMEFIYVRNLMIKNESELEPYNDPLPMSLTLSGKYELIYETGEIAILKVK